MSQEPPPHADPSRTTEQRTPVENPEDTRDAERIIHETLKVAQRDGLEDGQPLERRITDALTSAGHLTPPGQHPPEPSVVGPVGAPFPMYGFTGCTNRNPDLCACATDEDVECAACGEVIEPGVLTYAQQQGQPWLDPGDPEQDWVTLWWHATCDSRTTKTVSPSTATPDR